MAPIVAFDHVGKRYRRGRERTNLRAAVPGAWGRRLRGEVHDALRDLSFELEAGRSLGLIGPNGAGKSTTLKLVSHVIAPTTGRVDVRGRTASLIELGAGFHPDMTGRENVSFSASVLGMGPKALRDRFDDIVEFAGIGEYLDTPVKRYSSGMLARLGFSVATHLDAEVLVLDEVLAVGDAEFQRRCHQKIAEVCAQGVALLYVTHALWTLPKLCEEAILLSAGEVAARGTPTEVISAYERLQASGAIAGPTGRSSVLRSVAASHAEIEPGERLDVRVELDLDRPYPNGHVHMVLTDQALRSYVPFSSQDAGIVFDRPGRFVVTAGIDALPFAPGTYELHVGFVGDRALPAVDDLRSLRIDIAGDPADPTLGLVRVPAVWKARKARAR
jgi:ABC-type polysaccharide/polyol phosphate transport system ATPase subunit